jgi:chromosome segregation ATPase
MRQGIKILNHTQENRQLKYENLKFRNNALEPSKKIKQLEKEALEGLKSRTELLDSEEKVSQLQEEVSQLEEKYAKRKIQAQDFKKEIIQLKKKIVQRKDDCTKLKDAYVKLKKHRHETELAVDKKELEFNKELEDEKAKSARLQARLDLVGA